MVFKLVIPAVQRPLEEIYPLFNLLFAVDDICDVVILRIRHSAVRERDYQNVGVCEGIRVKSDVIRRRRLDIEVSPAVVGGVCRETDIALRDNLDSADGVTELWEEQKCGVIAALLQKTHEEHAFLIAITHAVIDDFDGEARIAFGRVIGYLLDEGDQILEIFLVAQTFRNLDVSEFFDESVEEIAVCHAVKV